MPPIPNRNQLPLKSNNSTEEKDYLKSYRTHGLDLELIDGNEEAKGECPFCNKLKFYVNTKTSKFSCKVCAMTGNLTTFLRKIYEYSKDVADDNWYETLRKDRKLLKVSTLKQWGVRKHFITGETIIPGYNPEGKIITLYRYILDRKSNKKLLYITPNTIHGLFAPSDTKGFADGPRLADVKEVFITEGPWDGMALYETMSTSDWDAVRAYHEKLDAYKSNGNAKGVEMKLKLAASKEQSLLREASIFAVPGCNVFYPQWPTVTSGKSAYLLFDNDHAKEYPPGSKRWVRTGYDGMKRVATILMNYEQPPKEINYLKWSPNTVSPGTEKLDGFDPSMPDGADVRDFLSVSSTEINGQKLSSEQLRRKHLVKLLNKLSPIPDKWLAGRNVKSSIGKAKGSTEIEPLKCSSWDEMILSWKKSMRWTEGLDRGLSLMFASIISTKSVGDPVWIMMISPPSTGKSVLCEAISVARKYVLPKSTIRGFHSGFDMSGKGEDDNSLISKLYNMTLVTKDGDTLLQAPNRSQILAEARDVYDKTSRTSYRNKMQGNYEGINMTWILCGTSSLRQLDSSELGERFLKCIIMEEIDSDLEDEILWRVANRAGRNVAQESNGVIETQYDPNMFHSMRVTGGYVEYVRENANKLLSAVNMDDESMQKCIWFGKFVAYLRARPSQKQDEIAEREFAARLVSQHVRVAKCLAAIMGKTTTDEEVMRRVTRTCLDTSRGRSLDIVKYLYKVGAEGADTRQVAYITNHTEEKERILLRFLKRIGVVEIYEPKRNNVRMKPRWRLTPRLRDLYEKVTNQKEVF